MGTLLFGYYETGTTLTLYCIEDGATIGSVHTNNRSNILDLMARPWMEHCLASHKDYTAQAPSSPYLTNGNFETWTTANVVADGWTLDGLATGTIIKETTLIHGGVNSMKITSEGDTADEGAYQALTVTAGESYVVTAWAKATNDAASIPRIQIYNVTDSAVVEEANGYAGTVNINWQPLSVGFTAVTGKTYRLRLLHKASVTASKIVYFDDVTVVQAS